MELMVAVEVEFDELLVCEPPAPFEPQPVSIARTSNRPVQDTVFIRISSRKFCGDQIVGSVIRILRDSILEAFTFERFAGDVGNKIGSHQV
jgi:hypothetical protein